MIILAQYEDQEAVYKIPLSKFLKIANIELTEAEVENAVKKAIINS
jgi:hypothetical protein